MNLIPSQEKSSAGYRNHDDISAVRRQYHGEAANNVTTVGNGLRAYRFTHDGSNVVPIRWGGWRGWQRGLLTHHSQHAEWLRVLAEQRHEFRLPNGGEFHDARTIDTARPLQFEHTCKQARAETAGKV